MKNITIRRPKWADVPKIDELFRRSITAALAYQGVSEDMAPINQEIAAKKAYLRKHLETNGSSSFFLIACRMDQIVGTIALGPCGEIIRQCSDGQWSVLPEVNTAFVLPQHQNTGVGTLMFNAILIALLSRGVSEFCLDSGYKQGQQFWRRRLGEPAIVKKDYWAEGADHMIWHCRLDELSIRY